MVALPDRIGVGPQWTSRSAERLRDTAALVLISKAHALGIRLPSLDYTDEETRLVVRRYQGFDDPNDPEHNAALEKDSNIKLGIYRVLEKYFAPLRD